MHKDALHVRPIYLTGVVAGLAERGELEALQELNPDIRKEFNASIIESLIWLPTRHSSDDLHIRLRDILACFPKLNWSNLQDSPSLFTVDKSPPFSPSYRRLLVRHLVNHTHNTPSYDQLIATYNASIQTETDTNTQSKNVDTIHRAKAGYPSDMMLELIRNTYGKTSMPSWPCVQKDQIDVTKFTTAQEKLKALKDEYIRDKEPYDYPKNNITKPDILQIRPTLFDACVIAENHHERQDAREVIKAAQRCANTNKALYNTQIIQLASIIKYRMLSASREPNPRTHVHEIGAVTNIRTHEIRAVCDRFPEVARITNANGKNLLHSLARTPKLMHAAPVICFYSLDPAYGKDTISNISLKQLGFPVQSPNGEIQNEPNNSVIGTAHANCNYEFRDMMRTYRQLSLIRSHKTDSHTKKQATDILPKRVLQLSLTPRDAPSEHYMQGIEHTSAQREDAHHTLSHNCKMHILSYLFAMPLHQNYVEGCAT